MYDGLGRNKISHIVYCKKVIVTNDDQLADSTVSGTKIVNCKKVVTQESNTSVQYFPTHDNQIVNSVITGKNNVNCKKVITQKSNTNIQCFIGKKNKRKYRTPVS